MIFRWLSLCLIVCNFLLMGCTPLTTASTISSPTSLPQQQLGISARVTFPDQTQVDLEVAKTPEQQELGLMNRPELDPNRGMLFVFSPSSSIQFWMKDTPVPLDMVFVYQDEVKYIQNSAPPCKSDPCPVYGANTLIDKVIELRAGRAQASNLGVGDRLKFEFFDH